MKPLLSVTNQEEKLNAKEEELKKIKENYERTKFDFEDLERKFASLVEEKSILSEQLQAETELCTEAEEVSHKSLQTLVQLNYKDAVFILLLCRVNQSM